MQQLQSISSPDWQDGFTIPPNRGPSVDNDGYQQRVQGPSQTPMTYFPRQFGRVLVSTSQSTIRRNRKDGITFALAWSPARYDFANQRELARTDEFHRNLIALLLSNV